jgi:hypothetical protein
MRLRRTGTVALMMALTMLFVIGPVGPANAVRTFACEAAGSVHIDTSNEGASWDWTLTGIGSCVGGTKGVLTVQFEGSGTSLTLGLCSGHLLLQELMLQMNMTYLNHKTGITTNRTEFWTAPISTYPTATPFLVESAPGNTNGVGVLFDHIFSLLDQSKCQPNGGAASSYYVWAEQSKDI